MGQDCAYTHDLAAFGHDLLDGFEDTGEWHCPHSTEADSEYCIFHQSSIESDRGRLEAKFAESVQSEDPRRRQFLGASIGTLQIRYNRLETSTNDPIVLAGASIEALDFEETTIVPHLDLTDATVGEIDCEGTTFLGDVYCHGTTIQGEAQFPGSNFRGDAYFRGCRFEGSTDFWDSDIAGTAYFRESQFDEQTGFWNASFGGITSFRRATFGAGADFGSASFAESAIFEELTVAGSTAFEQCEFDGPVEATGMRATAPVSFEGAMFARALEIEDCHVRALDFTNARFQATVSFDDTVVDSGLRLENAVCDQQATFDNLDCGHLRLSACRCRAPISLDGLALKTTADLTDTEFSRGLTLVPSRVEGECLVDLSEASIASGTIGLPSHGDVLYDLYQAEVGDLDLEGDEANPFEHVRLLETTFTDFDFSKYRDVLRPDWRLHTTTVAPPPTSASGLVQLTGEDSGSSGSSHHEPTPGELETTYLKAKNGAEASGDNTAAAEFFRKEMKYRRAQHRQAFITDGTPPRDRMQAGGRLIANSLLDITSGYGEQPWRVVATSTATILVFAILFALLRSSSVATLPADVILSIGAFVTLVLGASGQASQPLVSVLAQIEGFIGGFLIALFVFTLTRSIHR